jgi:predicted RNA polymerase sigma factor
MRPLQARCHLGLGKLLRRTGRHEEARAELSTAVAMLREMGMAYWLPEAERELAEAAGRASAPSGQSGSLDR